MAVTIQEDMFEVARLYEDSAGFIYALVAYAETGEEPGRDAPWYPSFVAFRDRIAMSAESHRHGKKGGRPKSDQGVCNPDSEGVRNPKAKGVRNPSAKWLETPSEKGFGKGLETPSRKGFARGLETENENENETEKENEGEWSAPAPDDVAAYSDANGLGIDAQSFCDYYSAQGWRLANGNPVLDWQAAARRWAAEDKRRRHDKPDAKLDERFARFAAIESEVIAS